MSFEQAGKVETAAKQLVASEAIAMDSQEYVDYLLGIQDDISESQDQKKDLIPKRISALIEGQKGFLTSEDGKYVFSSEDGKKQSFSTYQVMVGRRLELDARTFSQKDAKTHASYQKLLEAVKDKDGILDTDEKNNLKRLLRESGMEVAQLKADMDKMKDSYCGTIYEELLDFSAVVTDEDILKVDSKEKGSEMTEDEAKKKTIDNVIGMFINRADKPKPQEMSRRDFKKKYMSHSEGVLEAAEEMEDELSDRLDDEEEGTEIHNKLLKEVAAAKRSVRVAEDMVKVAEDQLDDARKNEKAQQEEMENLGDISESTFRKTLQKIYPDMSRSDIRVHYMTFEERYENIVKERKIDSYKQIEESQTLISVKDMYAIQADPEAQKRVDNYSLNADILKKFVPYIFSMTKISGGAKSAAKGMIGLIEDQGDKMETTDMKNIFKHAFAAGRSTDPSGYLDYQKEQKNITEEQYDYAEDMAKGLAQISGAEVKSVGMIHAMFEENGYDIGKLWGKYDDTVNRRDDEERDRINDTEGERRRELDESGGGFLLTYLDKGNISFSSAADSWKSFKKHGLSMKGMLDRNGDGSLTHGDSAGKTALQMQDIIKSSGLSEEEVKKNILAVAEQRYGKDLWIGKNIDDATKLMLIHQMLKYPNNNIADIIKHGAENGKESFKDREKKNSAEKEQRKEAHKVAKDKLTAYYADNNMEAPSSEVQEKFAAGLVAAAQSMVQGGGIGLGGSVPLDDVVKGLSLDMSAGYQKGGSIIPAIGLSYSRELTKEGSAVSLKAHGSAGATGFVLPYASIGISAEVALNGKSFDKKSAAAWINKSYKTLGASVTANLIHGGPHVGVVYSRERLTGIDMSTEAIKEATGDMTQKILESYATSKDGLQQVISKHIDQKYAGQDISNKDKVLGEVKNRIQSALQEFGVSKDQLKSEDAINADYIAFVQEKLAWSISESRRGKSIDEVRNKRGLEGASLGVTLVAGFSPTVSASVTMAKHTINHMKNTETDQKSLDEIKALPESDSAKAIEKWNNLLGEKGKTDKPFTLEDNNRTLTIDKMRLLENAIHNENMDISEDIPKSDPLKLKISDYNIVFKKINGSTGKLMGLSITKALNKKTEKIDIRKRGEELLVSLGKDIDAITDPKSKDLANAAKELIRMEGDELKINGSIYPLTGEGAKNIIIDIKGDHVVVNLAEKKDGKVGLNMHIKPQDMILSPKMSDEVKRFGEGAHEAMLGLNKTQVSRMKNFTHDKDNKTYKEWREAMKNGNMENARKDASKLVDMINKNIFKDSTIKRPEEKDDQTKALFVLESVFSRVNGVQPNGKGDGYEPQYSELKEGIKSFDAIRESNEDNMDNLLKNDPAKDAYKKLFQSGRKNMEGKKEFGQKMIEGAIAINYGNGDDPMRGMLNPPAITDMGQRLEDSGIDTSEVTTIKKSVISELINNNFALVAQTGIVDKLNKIGINDGAKQKEIITSVLLGDSEEIIVDGKKYSLGATHNMMHRYCSQCINDMITLENLNFSLSSKDEGVKIGATLSQEEVEISGGGLATATDETRNRVGTDTKSFTASVTVQGKEEKKEDPKEEKANTALKKGQKSVDADGNEVTNNGNKVTEADKKILENTEGKGKRTFSSPERSAPTKKSPSGNKKTAETTKTTKTKTTKKVKSSSGK